MLKPRLRHEPQHQQHEPRLPPSASRPARLEPPARVLQPQLQTPQEQRAGRQRRRGPPALDRLQEPTED